MEKKIITGHGFSYVRVIGKFEVKYNSDSKFFDNFNQAKSFYESLNGEKAIWDITTIPELLESSH